MKGIVFFTVYHIVSPSLFESKNTAPLDGRKQMLPVTYP